tara:strand:+ start:16072 stop:17181 length:1110 start_codon:yes stop_codon:yes gene_type:complete
MNNPLVHIINKEIFRQKRNIRAVGMDLDGNLTDIHRPEVYSLLWDRTLDFLPEDLRTHLDGHSFDDMRTIADFKLGWFLDMELGYLVLPDKGGKIIAVRRGNEPVRREEIAKIYGNGREINISQALNPDHEKPRFLPYSDGYDLIEGVIKSAMTRMDGPPTIRSIQQLDRALYLAHHSENGFKQDLMENPEAYGISPNEKLRDFLAGLKDRYAVFLLTNSHQEYTERILEALDILEYFDLVIADAKKPACFSAERPEKKALWEQLAAIGIDSPEEVFYMGDHLYKDAISAHQSGFLTGLRMRRDDITEVERKLGKYAGMRFETDGHMIRPTTDANEETHEGLNHILFQLRNHVHVLATKVQNLEPVLLY